MGVLDKWLRGVGSADRSRKPTPSRPADRIGTVARARQTTPVRTTFTPRPSVPVKTREPAVASAPLAVEPAEAVVATPSPAPETASPAAPAFDESLQKKLDRYFDRLRAVYPTGVITRLNTGQKKLAERGSQLRHLCGMENELDAFFALGGFTYERTAGGRPRNVQSADAQTTLVSEIKALFPDGISSAAALDRADHALYLRLRSAARLSGGTITDFLKTNDLNSKGDKTL